jgi:hypothetical protein
VVFGQFRLRERSGCCFRLGFPECLDGGEGLIVNLCHLSGCIADDAGESRAKVHLHIGGVHDHGRFVLMEREDAAIEDDLIGVEVGKAWGDSVAEGFDIARVIADDDGFGGVIGETGVEDGVGQHWRGDANPADEDLAANKGNRHTRIAARDEELEAVLDGVLDGLQSGFAEWVQRYRP